MIDREKISAAVNLIISKYGGLRAASKATGIDKQSLANYKDGITEPRGKNFEAIVHHSHKDPSLFYQGQGQAKQAPAKNDGIVTTETNKQYYRHANLDVHNDVEKILNSGDLNAISALKYGVGGIIKTVEGNNKILAILERIANGVDQLLEQETDLGEGAVLGPGRESRPQHKKRKAS